jgi:hypothetical protein
MEVLHLLGFPPLGQVRGSRGSSFVPGDFSRVGMWQEVSQRCLFSFIHACTHVLLSVFLVLTLLAVCMHVIYTIAGTSILRSGKRPA